ncbi:MAG: phosphate ABC transporter substrate-binding protein PstS [Symploca sp. SIO2C1]|nr:phosphate ABC transporter substrate-binding protein PstS [Symploca sp. SIO2C1]
MATFLRNQCKQIVAATLMATTIAVGINGADAQESLNPTESQSIKGAGASFPQLLYQRYRKEYESDQGVEFDYTSVGSGGGIRLFTNESINVGSSTLIPSPIEKNQMEEGLLMIPTAGGSVAIVYNLQNVTNDVKISREKLAKIFTGEISNWSQVSPRLPNVEIQVVVRSDDSGTSLILTKYLREITNGKVIAKRKPDWGADVFAARPQDSGVAAEVRRIDGAIGYVQTSFAKQSGLAIARLENQAGDFVRPTVEETQKALANIEFNEDLTTNSIDDPEEGYPLVSLTWLLVYQKYPNIELLESTQNLVSWILTDGQEFNEEEGYTKIPPDIAKRAIEIINNKLKVRPY